MTLRNKDGLGAGTKAVLRRWENLDDQQGVSSSLRIRKEHEVRPQPVVCYRAGDEREDVGYRREEGQVKI